jgi:hypothetical protein
MTRKYEYKDQVVHHKTLIETRCDKCNEVIDTRRYESHFNFYGSVANPYPEDSRSYTFQLCQKCTEELTTDWLIEYEEGY